MVWRLFAAAPVIARVRWDSGICRRSVERGTSARRCVLPGNEPRNNTARSNPAGSRLVTNEVL